MKRIAWIGFLVFAFVLVGVGLYICGSVLIPYSKEEIIPFFKEEMELKEIYNMRGCNSTADCKKVNVYDSVCMVNPCEVRVINKTGYTTLLDWLTEDCGHVPSPPLVGCNNFKDNKIESVLCNNGKCQIKRETSRIILDEDGYPKQKGITIMKGEEKTVTGKIARQSNKLTITYEPCGVNDCYSEEEGTFWCADGSTTILQGSYKTEIENPSKSDKYMEFLRVNATNVSIHSFLVPLSFILCFNVTAHDYSYDYYDALSIVVKRE
ncbi:hypothetical protein COY95_00255 [Candidatus Woesearchaeota archaeon CG_4_10_14_0_8_um_filter_47_5]|nr:MAG: hypothetical protein COY95_00255 [Candidatus Woesearchaeota archaeon CG_4_10_14_0_8_um_filter_47_5]